MISDLAVVETALLGSNVTIMEFAIVRPEVKIGSNVTIHPHVVIEQGVVIGDNVEIFPGAYIGKIPKGAGLARQPHFMQKVLIGSNCSIGPHAVIYYDVEIGDNTLIGDGATIREECRIGSNAIIGRYVAINYAATIGSGTKIMDLAIITGKCSIGNNVFVSMGVATANDNSIGRLPYDEAHIKGPIIEDEAAIGLGALLLPNITVKKNAVVAAGSVVTRDIPEKAMGIGIPARIIADGKEQ